MHDLNTVVELLIILVTSIYSVVNMVLPLYWFQLAELIITVIGVLYFLRAKKYRLFYIFSQTYRRDFRIVCSYLQLKYKTWRLVKENKTVASEFSRIVQQHLNKVAIYFEDEIWTFTQIEELINQVARYFKSQGFKKGDVVGLLLENMPEYPALWLGLSKLGVVTALINTNIRKDSLIYCINIAKCKAIIFGSNHAEPVRDVFGQLNPRIKLYQFHENRNVKLSMLPNCIDLRKHLEHVSPAEVVIENGPGIHDPLIYIYTSGTTGLPKAAIVTNFRYFGQTLAIYYGANLRDDDVIYVSLPLYHGAGNNLTMGQTLMHGITVALRKKFSASHYWSDCEKYKCTVAQYIGEMCRYILSVHYDKPVKHPVRLMLGNCLKPQIWNIFVKTFEIEQVVEFYGSTEGVGILINTDNFPSSIGFVPRYLRQFYPVTLIKYNQITGSPVRDKNGYCIKCDVNEPGLNVGKIDQKAIVFNYKGYCNEEESKKKILHGVFKDGDAYFNSGDILQFDEFGNFTFKDRTGDTYRWKGENVSASEVEGVISNLTQLNDAIVFGVEIPKTEGKAGMAVLAHPDKTVDLDLLSQNLKLHLPKYAIPMFIRIMETIPLTGTFKLQKYKLQTEGYDINKVKDVICYYNVKEGRYFSLTKELYQEILKGKIRF